MRLLRIALVLSLAFVPSVASASLITYDFTGANGLVGTFSLDDAVPFEISAGGPCPCQSGKMFSPTNTIMGSFGAYTFSGVATLYVTEYFPGTDILDRWDVRAGNPASAPDYLNGPAVNGKSVVALNLFNDRMSNGPMPISVIAPTPHYSSAADFAYTIGFSDGSFTGGRLLTLDMRPSDPTPVPEPASVVLLMLGGLFTLGAYRHRRVSLVRVRL